MNVIGYFDGEVYGFLSNFYPARVSLPDMELRAATVEHAFQAAKFLDQKKRALVYNAKSPGHAKAFGNKLEPLRDDWEQVKRDIMLDLLRQKFAVGSELAVKLLNTRGSYLVEGNVWHDNIWGVCVACEQCDGRGENALGKLLMRVRGEIAP